MRRNRPAFERMTREQLIELEARAKANPAPWDQFIGNHHAPAPTQGSPPPPPRPRYPDLYAGMPESEPIEDEPSPPPLIPWCPICEEPLTRYLCTVVGAAGRAHVRCLDWRGKPFPTALGLQQVRDRWPAMPRAVRAAILKRCQAWARLELGWPPDPLTGEAVEAVVVAAVDHREAVRTALQPGLTLTPPSRVRPRGAAPSS